MMTLAEILAQAQQQAARKRALDSAWVRLGAASSALQGAVIDLADAYSGRSVRPESLIRALAALLRIEPDLAPAIAAAVEARARREEADRQELRSCLVEAYAEKAGEPDWPRVMGAILDAAVPGSEVELLVCTALVALGRASNTALADGAWARAGVETCDHCEEPSGIDCGTARQCPTCKGHYYIAGREGYDPNCADCGGDGSRDAYDRVQCAQAGAMQP